MEGSVIRQDIKDSKNPDHVITVNWKIGKFLGKGAYGNVYVISDGKKEYAGKIIKKSKISMEQKVNEIKIHETLNNQNIVNLIDEFETPDYFVIILDNCEHGDMKHLIKARRRLTETEVKYYALNILKGIEYLHSQNIIHRDIKLANVLLCGNKLTPKITDFGLAKLLVNGNCVKQVAGTPNYIAPEVIDKKCYSYSVDIWSYGVLVYALLFGKPAFETNDIKTTYYRIRHGIYYFKPDINVSDYAKDFIKLILVVNPDKRATIEQLKNHPFLTRGFIPDSLPPIAAVIQPSF